MFVATFNRATAVSATLPRSTYPCPDLELGVVLDCLSVPARGPCLYGSAHVLLFPQCTPWTCALSLSQQTPLSRKLTSTKSRDVACKYIMSSQRKIACTPPPAARGGSLPDHTSPPLPPPGTLGLPLQPSTKNSQCSCCNSFIHPLPWRAVVQPPAPLAMPRVHCSLGRWRVPALLCTQTFCRKCVSCDLLHILGALQSELSEIPLRSHPCCFPPQGHRVRVLG
jgi:hypothetical protein